VVAISPHPMPPPTIPSNAVVKNGDLPPSSPNPSMGRFSSGDNGILLGHYMAPTQTSYMIGEIPQNYHPFAL